MLIVLAFAFYTSKPALPLSQVRQMSHMADLGCHGKRVNYFLGCYWPLDMDSSVIRGVVEENVLFLSIFLDLGKWTVKSLELDMVAKSHSLQPD